jgi:hypothetical protein
VAAVALLAACSNGARLAEDDGSIYIRYVGSPAGVYDAFCDPVSEAPAGRLVQLETIKDVNIIDATYEYLPDGLELPNSTSENKFADCHDFDLKPVVTTPATTEETVPTSDQTTSTSAPPTTGTIAPPTTIAP